MAIPPDNSRDELATVTRAGTPVSATSGTGARLRAVHPRALQWEVEVGSDKRIAGRVPQDGVPPLSHETVSRKHIEIGWSRRARAHIVRDLGSHNGSRVDGVDLDRDSVALADQSVLQLGDVSLVYERLDPTTFDADAASRDAIPGRAVSVARLRDLVQRAAGDPSPVLLIGETGTGKEWISREVHRLSRRRGPLVAINCAALSPQIIDSQLFGHIKGAFTGATSDNPGMFRAADGGTLFLDEIGEMPLLLQPKLLRALQEGDIQPVGGTKPIKVDVRVVAATNRRLTEAVEAGTFRRDLYARLALWEIDVPALQQRRSDLLAWIDRLHDAWRRDRPGGAHQPFDFSAEAVERLLLYEWPNNLRELDRLVHALASAPSLPSPLGVEHLPAWVSPAAQTPLRAPMSATVEPVAGAKPPVPTQAEFETAFEQLEGNVRALAKHFRRDRRQIYRWIESYGLGDRRAGANRPHDPPGLNRPHDPPGLNRPHDPPGLNRPHDPPGLKKPKSD